MKLKLILSTFLILLLMPLLVSAQDATEEATRESTTAETEEIVPTEHEIFFVLDYSVEHFDPAQWRLAAAEEAASNTYVLWRRLGQEDFLFFYLYVHFDAGVTEQAVADYFSESGFESLLANYVPYEKTAECTAGDVTLYEFTSNRDDIKRIVRYWVQTVSDTRVMGVNGIAPSTSVAAFDEYSAILFPEIPSCEPLEREG